MAHFVRFDYFEVDLDSGQLYKRGIRIKLREQSFQVLAALVEHPGGVVTRDDLRQRLWHNDVFVDFDNNLNIIVARLREALGDSAEHPRFVETLPKHGYRFLAAVSEPTPFTEGDSATRTRLLVLPFANLGGDPAQEYFGDAITDEIITELAALAPKQLGVIARTTAMHYKGSVKDISRIGRELQVDYVVEGGVRRTGDRIGVNLQLIQVRDQTHLFAQKYDARFHDIFFLHNCIAQDILRHVPGISGAVRDGLTVHEVRKKPTENLAAYNEYIKGRFEMWKMVGDSLWEAKRHFETAVARDPAFADACNALAELYWYIGLCGYAPSRQTDQMGRSYALRSMEIDNTSAETHVLLSFYPENYNSPDEINYYDWAQIQKSVARARELNPNLRLVQLRYAMVEAVLGRPEKAAAELEHALELDPLSLDIRTWLAIMHFLGRHSDRAIEQAQRVLDLEPDHFLPHHLFGYAYLGMQKFEESAAAFRQAAELSRGWLIDVAFHGLALGLGGHATEAKAVLDRLQRVATEQYVPPTCFAWIHLGLGNIDEAFLWMDRAVDAPDRLIEPIKTYPFLESVRSDPRFAVLLSKMNLESASNESSREARSLEISANLMQLLSV